MDTTAIKPLHKAEPQTRGFSLIELMIALAIVAIIAAVAYPGYTSYMQKARRAEARAALMQASIWMERVATARGNYLTNTEANAFPAGSFPVGNAANPTYVIGVLASSLDANGSAYVLQAIPQVNSPQNRDPCGTFAINQSGLRMLYSANGTTRETNASLVATCWG